MARRPGNELRFVRMGKAAHQRMGRERGAHAGRGVVGTLADFAAVGVVCVERIGMEPRRPRRAKKVKNWLQNGSKEKQRSRNYEWRGFREWGHEFGSIRVHPWLGFGFRARRSLGRLKTPRKCMKMPTNRENRPEKAMRSQKCQKITKIGGIFRLGLSVWACLGRKSPENILKRAKPSITTNGANFANGEAYTI